MATAETILYQEIHCMLYYYTSKKTEVKNLEVPFKAIVKTPLFLACIEWKNIVIPHAHNYQKSSGKFVSQLPCHCYLNI